MVFIANGFSCIFFTIIFGFICKSFETYSRNPSHPKEFFDVLVLFKLQEVSASLAMYVSSLSKSISVDPWIRYAHSPCSCLKIL